MAWASERKRAKIAAISGGSRSPVSIEMSCPSFIAAPRICESCCVTLCILAGVSSKSLILGCFPWASCFAPAISMLPATPEAMPPKRNSRPKRLLGTAELLGAVEAVFGIFRGAFAEAVTGVFAGVFAIFGLGMKACSVLIDDSHCRVAN